MAAITIQNKAKFDISGLHEDSMKKRAVLSIKILDAVIELKNNYREKISKTKVENQDYLVNFDEFTVFEDKTLFEIHPVEMYLRPEKGKDNKLIPLEISFLFPPTIHA